MEQQQQQFLQQFADAGNGVSKYISLDALQLGIPYEITQFRILESTYGRCLAVDLAVGFWLVLPKRIGDLVTTDEKLNWLNSQNYWLIFKGRHEKYRKMAMIEFKTMDQFLMEQATAALDLPQINFEIENVQSGTVLKEVQNVEMPPPPPPAISPSKTTKQDVPKENAPKPGAAPKVTIKVKKERR